MKGLLMISALILILPSCSPHAPAANSIVASDTLQHAAATARHAPIPTGPLDNTHVVEDTTYYPDISPLANDPNGEYAILQDGGIIHGKEVPDNSESRKWYGIFKSPKGYYIAATRIRIKRAYDGIMDPDDTTLKTGKIISALHRDTLIALISGPRAFAEGPVMSLVDPLDVSTLTYDTLYFTFNRKNYELFATAIRRNDGVWPGTYSFYNGKAYMRGPKNGKEITQLIRATPFLIYQSIIFVGDLDGDGIPDMIYDMGNENGSALILYLSGSAGPDELLKLVAAWETTGC